MSIVEDSKKLTEKLIEISTRLPSNPKPEKKGGFLFIGYRNLTDNYLIGVGEYDPAKEETYKRIAQEKAYRLYADWLRDPSSVSSWQTRDVETKRYGGAIIFPDSFLGETICNLASFSGAAEWTDESFSLINGLYRWDGFNVDRAKRIASISENPVFGEMLRAWQSLKR